MPAALLSFQKPPTFGFAHHLYTEEPCQNQTNTEHSFVLAYVKSGHLTISIQGRLLDAPTGSLILLFRDYPFSIHSRNNEPQDYCSIQVYTDYSFSFMEDNEDFPADFCGMVLPMVTPPCPEVEKIKKDMFSIVSNLSISRETYGFYSAMSLCGILAKLDMNYRQKIHKGKTVASYWEYKIKQYVADHIREQVTLQDLSREMDKTPNYLNSVFHQATGISIHQYINREKVRLIASLMEMQRLPFPQACENVGIADISHGYRLFRKHMGVTPKEYMVSEHFHLGA